MHSSFGTYVFLGFILSLVPPTFWDGRQPRDDYGRTSRLLLEAEGRPRAEVTVGQCADVDLQCLPEGHMLKADSLGPFGKWRNF